MATVTTRPNGTAFLGGAVVTGEMSAHAALADESDSSYVEISGAATILGVATPSVPAGAVVKGMALRLRTSEKISGSAPRGNFILYPDYSYSQLFLSGTLLRVPGLPGYPGTFTFIPSSPLPSSPIYVALTIGVVSGGANFLVFAAYVDTTYVAKPTLTVTAPTGTLTDANTPTVTWTETLDSDGGPQTKYEVKVFSAAQYGAGGFDPSTSAATYTSGTLSGSALSHDVTTALANATYRAYVRVGQTVNSTTHWSDWDYEGFVENVTPPDAPAITLTAQAADGRIKVDLDDAATSPSTDLFEVQVSRDGGTTWEAMRLLTDDDGRVSPGSRTNLVTNPSFETNTTGWSTSAPAYHLNSGAVLTRVAPTVVQSGAYVGQIVTPGSAAAEGVAYAFSGYTFLAGTAYTLSMRVMANSATNVDLILGKASADHTKTDPTLAAGVWTDISVTWTPAANGTAVYAILRTDLGGAAVARTIQFDKVMVEAASSAGTYIEGVEGTTVYDYEAANGVATYYRARALHGYSGIYAASAWTTANATWSSASWWIKHPNQPALNLAVVPYGLDTITRGVRQGVFEVAGRSLPVVVSDSVRSGATGTVTFLLESGADRDALAALLDTCDTLLLQGRDADYWDDRYVRFGEHSSARVADKAYVADTVETLPWTEVDSPAGVVEDWSA